MSTRAAVLILCLCACKDPTGGATGGLVAVSETAPLEFGPPPECEDTGSPAPEDMADPPLDPGTLFCATLTSAAACDGAEHEGGVCRWLDVVPVEPGTCEITQLYRACVFVPAVSACVTETACGQIGLGVHGRVGCDGAIELVLTNPSDGLCGPPADFPLCAGDDPAPECTCACT